MTEFAPGIPDKNVYVPISQKGRTRLIIQKHIADKAGKHFDMRLRGPGGIAHSWVIKSLPGERDKILAIQQPTHTSKYMNFQGKIESGYGAGTVKKVYDEKIRILHADNNKIKMVLPEGTFTMIKPKNFGNDKNWLMIKSAAFIDELEKIADNYLYHYFDPVDVKAMIAAGGIIPKYRNETKKKSISTTYNPEKSIYLINPTGNRKDMLRARIIEEKLGKEYPVKIYNDPKYTNLKKNISEYEKRIYSENILPWDKIDKIEVIKSNKLRTTLREIPKFISENPRKDLRNLSFIIKKIKMIKNAAFIDELEKIAAIHPLIKSGLIYVAGIGALTAPTAIAYHYNKPALNNLSSIMEYGNADARATIKQYDPSVMPLTSASQVDTAHISILNKMAIKSMIDKKGKFKNSAFVPGTNRQRYIVTPEKTDSSLIRHELGHARHYLDSVITPNISRSAENKKWVHYNSIKREELANKFAPGKSVSYNKTMIPLLNTYKRVDAASKATKGVLAGEMATGFGLLGAGILKHFRKR